MKKFLREHLEECEQLLKEIPAYATLTNVAYALEHNKPIKKCVICGKYIPYKNIRRGKDKFCSQECYRSPEGLRLAKEQRAKTNMERFGNIHGYSDETIAKSLATKKERNNGAYVSQETKDKVRNTMIERYGAPTTFQSEVLYKKAKDTMRERYGVEHPLQSKEIKEKIKNTVTERYGAPNAFIALKEQIKKINLERYGEEYAAKSKIIQDKIKATNKEKYGCSYPLENEAIKKLSFEKRQEYNKDKFIQRIEDNNFELLDDYKKILGTTNLIRCKTCGTVIERNLSASFSFRCPHCNPYNNSTFEKEVKEFIGKYIVFDSNNRKLLSDKELDIVIYEKSLAIECDGLFWHSDYTKDKNYHLYKTNACEAKGIQLIHIFENEWRDKQQIVKSRLKHILGMVKNKIFARKCTVKEISNSLANKFIDKYHLQGKHHAAVCLGLFYKTHLVAVMTFSKPRFNKNYNWELLRYAAVANFNIIGGAGKLLSYFRKNYSGSIISYADRRWSNGNLYRKLGFTELAPSAPSYFYTRGNEVISRFAAQKHKLKKFLKDFDENKTEKENMLANGYNRIYDCGNRVFILN